MGAQKLVPKKLFIFVLFRWVSLKILAEFFNKRDIPITTLVQRNNGVLQFWGTKNLIKFCESKLVGKRWPRRVTSFIYKFPLENRISFYEWNENYIVRGKIDLNL